MQLRFASFAVISLREDFHLQECARAGRTKEKADFYRNQPFALFLARPERFERPTPWFVAKYSIQLSYGRAATTKRRII